MIRFDRGKFQSTVKPRLIEGVVARVHAVGDELSYADGPEYRELKDLQDIVDQLPGLPVVTYAEPNAENPPSHPEGLLVDGADYHEIGRVMGARLEDGKAVAQIYIHDKGALQAVEDGIKELSLGYRCTLDGERFQRNIKLDHLSLVSRARCGATCSLRTDSTATKCPCLAQSVPDANILSMQVGEMTVGLKITLDEESEKILNSLQSLDTTLNAAARKELAPGDFAVPERKAFPIHDEAHVRAAMSRFGQGDFTSTAEKKTAYHKILAKAKSMGMDTSGFEKAWSGKMDESCTCNSHAMPHTNGESTMDAAEIQKKLDEALAKIAELETEITGFKTAKTDEAAALAVNQATADLKAETARADRLAGEIETIRTSAQAEVAAAKAARTDAEHTAFLAAVDTRVELLADAVAVGIDDAKSKTDREIKVAIVAKVDGMTVEDDRSADYVNGMYAGAMKRHTNAAASVAEVRTAIVEKQDAAAQVATDPYKKEAEISAAVEAKRANRWR